LPNLISPMHSTEISGGAATHHTTPHPTHIHTTHTPYAYAAHHAIAQTHDGLIRPIRPPTRSSTQCDATWYASVNQDRSTVPDSRTQMTTLIWPARSCTAQHGTRIDVSRPAAQARQAQCKHKYTAEHSSARRAGARGRLQRAGRGEPEGAAQPSRERERKRRQGVVVYFGGLQRYAPGPDWDFAVAWAWRRAGGWENEVGGWSYRGGGSSPECWRRGPRDVFVCLVVVEGGGGGGR
jgi:hypothetical protein